MKELINLSDYVCECITEITKGVKEAQKRCKNDGTIVNPANIEEHGGVRFALHSNNVKIMQPVQDLHFDVQVSINESKENTMGGKIGLAISVFNGNIGEEHLANLNNSHSGNLSFTIPVCFPVDCSE